MVENSLGRVWISGHEGSMLKSDWKYFINDAEQEKDAEKELKKIKEKYSLLKPEDIKCIDPCAGSGHICVYLFDVLIQIYESYGISAREAASIIVKHNIYGLDIDERAAQLAYFSVMMKARQYDRRFFSKGIQPNIMSIPESNDIDNNFFEYFCKGNFKIEQSMNEVIRSLRDAKEYGSLTRIGQVDYQILFERLKQIDNEINISQIYVMEHIKPLIQAAYILSQKYTITVTNPPYMGNKGFSSKLLTYITKYYKEGKIDLYAAFIKRCAEFTCENGLFAMVTPESWMFLSRFEKLRRPYLESSSFINMLHLGFNAFDSGFGTVAFISIKADIKTNKATCYRLVDYSNAEEKENAIWHEKPYLSSKTAYYLVDGVPICYWVSDNMLNNFSFPKVKDNGKTCVGLLTGNNERFLRFWYEIDYSKLGIGYTHDEAREAKDKKWFPINQYGEYRKWFGNNLIVFDWEDDGHNIKKFKMDRYLAGEAEKKNSMCWNEDTYFCPGVTWNRISTNKFSARMSPVGNTAGSSSPIYFPVKRPYYLLALFNSCVFSSIVSFLNPTVSFQTTDIEKVPVIFGDETIDEMAKENTNIAEEDWNLFETSYGFRKNPLI